MSAVCQPASAGWSRQFETARGAAIWRCWPRTERTDKAVARRLYLDTSAYLCILLGEEGSERLSADTAGAELLSSVLLVLEARRNLVRLARAGSLKAGDYKVCIERVDVDRNVLTLRDLTLELCESNLLPAVTTPRSLDLAHLRTAAWFHADEPITRFVTRDDSQREAARELGLPV